MTIRKNLNLWIYYFFFRLYIILNFLYSTNAKVIDENKNTNLIYFS